MKENNSDKFVRIYNEVEVFMRKYLGEGSSLGYTDLLRKVEKCNSTQS